MENLNIRILKDAIVNLKKEQPELFKITISNEDSITPQYLSEIEKPEDIYDDSFCYAELSDVVGILETVCEKLSIDFFDIPLTLRHKAMSYLQNIIEITEDHSWKTKRKFRAIIYPYQGKNINLKDYDIAHSLAHIGSALIYGTKYDDTVIPSESPVRELLRSQGYSIHDLFKTSESAFLSDFKDMIKDLYRKDTGAMFMGIPITLTFNDYFKLKSGKTDIILHKNTPVLLWNPFSGIGTDDNALTETMWLININFTDDPTRQNKKIPDLIVSLEDKPAFGYSIQDEYDLPDNFWKTEYTLMAHGLPNSDKIVWL